jgi:hypothetical protein
MGRAIDDDRFEIRLQACERGDAEIRPILAADEHQRRHRKRLDLMDACRGHQMCRL